MPNGLTPNEHEERRRALGISKSEYAKAIGLSPAMYQSRTNPQRSDLDEIGGANMNNNAIKPKHIKCPNCGCDVPLSHEMTQQEVRQALSKRSGIPVESLQSLTKKTGLAIIEAWDARVPRNASDDDGHDEDPEKPNQPPTNVESS